MTARPVEAVWVWRFTKAPFKATYGRLPGTTYSKDFLQAIGECATALDTILGREQGKVVNLRWEWPGGSRNGTLFEAADHDENGRLDLRWETNNSPEPWRLFPEDDSNPLKTLPGDPTHGTANEADEEFAALQARDLDPWLVVVKLFGEPATLHARAYLGRPSPELAHASTSVLPQPVRATLEALPPRRGCAVWIQPLPVVDEPADERVLFDPLRIHDAWTTETMEPADFRRLVRMRSEPAISQDEPRRRAFSRSYRPANIEVRTAEARVFTRDPDEVDRGLRGHNVTQERLAQLVREAGLTPGSPLDSGCDYDIAWERAGMIYVAEVKSLTNQNERLQLRLGLGQVLEYAHRLRSEGWVVQPVLAVEREPNDPTWEDICEAQGVRLVWPGNMGTLF